MQTELYKQVRDAILKSEGRTLQKYRYEKNRNGLWQVYRDEKPYSKHSMESGAKAMAEVMQMQFNESLNESIYAHRLLMAFGSDWNLTGSGFLWNKPENFAGTYIDLSLPLHQQSEATLKAILELLTN